MGHCINKMKRMEYLLENFYFLENCNNLASLRKAIDTDVLKSNLIETMHPCLEVLSGIMHRLQLKKQSFKVFKPASDDAIHELWSVLLGIEKSLQAPLEYHSSKTFNKYGYTQCSQNI